MAQSISIVEHAYILENDRPLPEVEQSVFWIIPKTVKSSAETASNYAKITRENRRKGRSEIDAKAMQNADDAEWVRCIKKIENFFVTDKAPDGAYEHFLVKADATKKESEPAKYVKLKDGRVKVVSTVDEKDLLYIFHSMSVADSEEVISAVTDYSRLSDLAKN